MYTNLKRMYEAVVGQYNRYMGHVAMSIGGRFVTNLSIEMEGNKYAPVPKAQQKRALSFLNQKVFTRPAWLVEQPYIFNLTDTPDTYLYPLVNNVISASSLLNLGRLDRMEVRVEAAPDCTADRRVALCREITATVKDRVGVSVTVIFSP